MHQDSQTSIINRLLFASKAASKWKSLQSQGFKGKTSEMLHIMATSEFLDPH